MTEKYLELLNVSKNYKNFKAVDNLSLSIYKADIYGFLGPNGAGKSTSIRMILSLIKPDSGLIKLFGNEISKDRVRQLSRVGALIEKSDFYKYLTARKNLQILGKLSGVKSLDDRVDELLEMVGLLERAESKVGTFSQGMKQRLGIAQTLIHKPDLIILDEPANGLDPQGQREIRNLIKRINQEEGITILISSHILSEIEEIANRMIIINRGRKIIEGKVNDLMYEENMKIIIETDDSEKSVKLIDNSYRKGIIENVNGSSINLITNKKDIAAINKLLIENNINVYSIRPIKNLEEYFLSKVAND